jgi:hypothetical protein
VRRKWRRISRWRRRDGHPSWRRRAFDVAVRLRSLGVQMGARIWWSSGAGGGGGGDA